MAESRRRRSRRRAGLGVALLALAGATARAAPPPSATAAAAALFDRVAASPPRLRVFLAEMPKGGDLHNHLWGGAYAEEFLAWGADDGLCAERAARKIVAAPCRPPASEPLRGLGARDQALYAAMIDALSTRGRDQGLGVNDTTGHDDFFVSFDRFGAEAERATARMIASQLRSSARNRVSYLELMANPPADARAARLALDRPWSEGDLAADFAGLAPALPGLVADARRETDDTEARVRALLGCDGGTPAPSGVGGAARDPEPAAACAVTLRYQVSALRSLPPAFVFGQLALGFALADRDPRFVGVNLVEPEDWAVPVADFDLHMRMFQFLHAKYPNVRIALHAGELALGLVPRFVLDRHIRDSIEIGGASRIGHGVAVAYERDAPGLLAEMAAKRIAVEIALTSNDAILGVEGAAHPLALYRAAGVPFVLATDDEGVSRSDMTNEYLRAATEQHLRYPDLKAAARASLEYAFLPGASLWRDGAIGARAPACAGAPLAPPLPGGACGALIAASDKARAQWRLERDLAAFEARVVTLRF